MHIGRSMFYLQTRPYNIRSEEIPEMMTGKVDLGTAAFSGRPHDVDKETPLNSLDV